MIKFTACTPPQIYKLSHMVEASLSCMPTQVRINILHNDIVGTHACETLPMAHGKARAHLVIPLPSTQPSSQLDVPTLLATTLPGGVPDHKYPALGLCCVGVWCRGVEQSPFFNCSRRDNTTIVVM